MPVPPLWLLLEHRRVRFYPCWVKARLVCRNWDVEVGPVLGRLLRLDDIANLERLAVCGTTEAFDWVVATFPSPAPNPNSCRRPWGRILLACQETCHVDLVRWVLPAITRRQACARDVVGLQADTTQKIARLVCDTLAVPRWPLRSCWWIDALCRTRELWFQRYGRHRPRVNCFIS